VYGGQPGTDTQGRRILVVDDDTLVRRVFSRALSRAAYQVDCAEDGEGGWEALCANRFDLLITDHSMPRLTGLNLVRRIRNGPVKVPVIMVSGTMPWEEHDLLELLSPGVALAKPVSIAELLAHVRRLLAPSGSPER
jgi:DNA-binding response OmpR family regulator